MKSILILVISLAISYSQPAYAQDAHETKSTENPHNPTENSRPNIVLIMVDDLGIGDVGCFGNKTLRTPNIDRIASEGVKLTHHLTAAAVCTPSRAAFLTGRYPIRMGMVPTHVVRVNMFVSSISGLPENETTIAELAKQQGYNTGFIGKWHLGLHCTNSLDYCHHPLKQGFDYYYGVPLTNIKDFGDDGETVTKTRIPQINILLATISIGGCLFFFFLHKLEVVQGSTVVILCLIVMIPTFLFVLVTHNLAILNGIVMRNYEVVEQPIRLEGFTQRLAHESVQFLERQKEEENPFLLVVSWLQVHTAMHTARKNKGRSKHGPYGDNVEEMDWSVGEILNALDTLGIADNTFVYFTSDNGGHNEETGIRGNREGGYNGIYRGGKAQGGMDGGIRVPTVARWPEHIPPKSLVNSPTSLMDIFPTLASLMGAPLPKDRIIDGVDIIGLLTHEEDFNAHEHLIHYCGNDIHAARYTPSDGTGNVWKVHFATPNWEPGTEGCGYICDCAHAVWHSPPLLYNIGKDPSELKPIRTSQPEYEPIMKKFKQAVAEHKKTVDVVPNQYQISAMLPRPWLQPCCNFPYCHCLEDISKVPGIY